MLDGKTNTLGVIGDPISHSLSPVMHNKAILHLGINYCYVPLLVKKEQLKEAIEGIKSLNITGVNVTSPHKEEVFNYLDEVSIEAKKIGAVNTIVREEERLIGYNTDGRGFVRSIQEENFDPEGKVAVILGIGGAAKAVGFSLLEHNIKELRFINRTYSKAKSIALELNEYFDSEKVKPYLLEYDKLLGLFGDVDLVINGLPMDPVSEKGEWFIPLNELDNCKNTIAVDFRYLPRESEFLKACKEKGLITMNGLMMLLYQGVLAFEHFTSQKAPVEVMKRSLFENI